VELLTGGEPSLRLTSRPEDWQVAAECITEPDQLPVDHPSELGPRQSADTVALDWPTDDHVDRIALHVERGEGAEYLGCVLLEQHSPAGEAVPSS
jgi:hypothetical protein